MGINLRKNKNSKNAGYGKYHPEVDLLAGICYVMNDIYDFGTCTMRRQPYL